MTKIFVACAVAWVATLSSAGAQSFPTRPVTLVVPFVAGGTTDALARIVARGMSVSLGQNVIIENMGGAGGTVGTQRVARAAPDGYTIGLGNLGTLAANVSLYPKLAFDPRRDFTPIGVAGRVPMVLAASPKSGIRNVEEFLTRLKAEGANVKFGTPGLGSAGHLASAVLLQRTGLQGTLVPYRGMAPALTDLAGGTIDVVVEGAVNIIPAHQGGTAVALAVSGDSRLPQIPDVPTSTEAGLTAFNMVNWNMIVAPKETPSAVVERLSGALDAALEDPQVSRLFNDLAVQIPPPAHRRMEYARDLVAAEVEAWAGIIQAAGLKTEGQ